MADMQVRRRLSGKISLLLVLFLTLLVTAGAGAGWYYVYVQNPLQERLAAQQDLLVRLSGLLNPVNNKLDPMYTDADGDLVADVPTDVTKQRDPQRLRVCYIYSDEPGEYKAAFADFAAYLSKATGKPVDYVDMSSLSEQLSALKHGQLDITVFNTGSVPIAVSAAGFVPVGCLGSEKGSSKYEMEIIARPDSGIQSVADLTGRELALTDPGSNSGYKAPLVLIKADFGLMPGKDFGVRYSGGHEESIRSIADGTYQAAAVASDVLDRKVAAGDIKPEQFKVIYKSESFPTAAVGYAHDLSPELADKIRAAIFAFRFPGTSMDKLFAGTGQDRFVPVDYKNDWALVRRIDDAIGFAYQVK